MNYKLQNFINKITFGLTEMGPGFSLRDIWYNLKFGFRNLRKFFWVVWKHRPWDYQYNLDLLKRGMEVYLKDSQNSYAMEVDESRLPKEKDMRRAIEIIERLGKSDYITDAEKELGELQHYDIEFKKVNDPEISSEDLFEMVDNRTEKEKEHSTKVYTRSDEIEQSEWNELFDLIKKNGQGWWN